MKLVGNLGISIVVVDKYIGSSYVCMGIMEHEMVV